MDARVRGELEGTLAWAQAVRGSMDREPDRRDELQMQGHAYVGGVLTTLDGLGLLTRSEYDEWSERLNGVLGDPPGGWVAG